MGEARKVIFTFLILLFVIIGLGVVFSRMSKNKDGKPILGGVLDNVFFSKSLRLTPTPKTGVTVDSKGTAPAGNTITIRNDSVTVTPAVIGEYKGGNNPSTIPATGTPTVVLLFSGMGLGAGYLIKRFSR